MRQALYMSESMQNHAAALLGMEQQVRSADTYTFMQVNVMHHLDGRLLAATGRLVMSSQEVTFASAAYLLILQVKVLGNLHALQPADVARLVSSLVEGFFQGVGLLQGHDVQGVPGTPGQNI